METHSVMWQQLIRNRGCNDHLSEFRSRSCPPGKTENLADRVYAWYRGLDIEAVERDYSRKENEIYAKDIEFRNTLIEFVDR